MCNRCPGRGIFFVIFFCLKLIFCVVRRFYEAGFLIFALDESNLGLLLKNSFKISNCVSMTKSATENNWNLTETVDASYENDIGSIEVLGGNVWRSFGVFLR